MIGSIGRLGVICFMGVPKPTPDRLSAPAAAVRERAINPGIVKDLAWEVYAAVAEKRLAEPFGAEAVERACPGWAGKTYRVFLATHAVGNPVGKMELFVRVSIRTLPISLNACGSLGTRLPALVHRSGTLCRDCRRDRRMR